MNHGMKSLDKEQRDAGAPSYSSTKKLLLEYLEADSGRAWSGKRKGELDIRLRWIRSLLNLDSTKEDDPWI